ncbi:extracellular solute-binding protein [Salinibacterium sp. dk2585]|uniref:extracellular solute-binding protein n=1 Tax=unclassified Salinibacterium TaxID=2632331 RepID=UPI0011C253FD|nr:MULTISPECIES: extracellular solute-binding protein [unclassified Salinibacterium]QEE60710.1 extracellular solute-binding protein [Salinibacterium sp. dk2585]TXK55782.1 extracellular solute-binding protein [Salinibacterium sp. dk5596]
MNRSRITRVAAVGAASALALGFAACSSEGGGDNDNGDSVTITWWHNATSDPLKGIYEEVAAEFEAENPGVKVEVTGYQNEDLQRTLIPNALQSGDAPDVFMVWPGGEVRAQAEAGHLMDLTDVASESIEAMGASVAPWTVEGKVYAVPYAFGAAGIWYNQELFDEAGIEGTPETLAELEDAVEALKAIDVEPIAVGAGDLWPAGHWWYQFAVASCPTDVLETAIPEHDFTDPCWIEAGERLQDWIANEPFNNGFLATPAQTGADSSNGLIANRTAAMEFMGPWNAGTIGNLTEDGEVPEWLGWFPFPSVDGASGDPGAIMGGGDGFGVSADAPDEAVELLKYIVSEDVQRRFAESGAGVPTHPAAADALTDPNLQASAAALSEATYVQLWIDSALGPAFGAPLNQAVVNIFAGSGTPQDVVAALEQTAASQ